MFNQIRSEDIATKPVAAPAPLPASFAPPQPTHAKVHRPPKPEGKPLTNSSAAAYARDVRYFNKGGGTIPCDCATLKKYIVANRLKVAPTTLYRLAMSVRNAHLSQGLPSPTDDPAVRPLLRALQQGYVPKLVQGDGAGSVVNAKRREPKPAPPVTRRLLVQMLDLFGRNSLDRRDRALLLLGFMGALKRSELVAINVGDLRFTADALIVTIRSDSEPEELPDVVGVQQAKARRQIAIALTGGELCAATAVKQWIEYVALDIEAKNGPLFTRFDRGGDPTGDRLDGAYLNVILKGRLKAVGVDPTPFSAHSLRRGRLMEIGKGTL